MNKKTKAFVTEFQALMKKHGVTISESEEYNPIEEYIGSTFYFSLAKDSIEISEKLNPKPGKSK